MLKKQTIQALHKALEGFPGQNEKSPRKKRVREDEKPSFSPAEVEYFRSLIVGMRDEILEDIQRLQLISHEEAVLYRSRQSKLLSALQAALARIEKGEYGRCLSCGRLIEKERLAAVPHTRQCVVCKEGEKRRGVAGSPSADRSTIASHTA